MKKFILLLLFFSAHMFLHGQTKVEGYVVDASGNPIPFANVIYAGTIEGTITNEKGKFYLESEGSHSQLKVSFIGFRESKITLSKKVNYNMQIVLEEEAEAMKEIVIYSGKTDKKNNPAIDILRKIWSKKKQNGLKRFKQYAYDKYEKVEFDLNTIDSTLVKSRVFKGMEFIFEQTDTSKVTGKTYLPIFINEQVSTVYGDNEKGLKREDLKGNKNSGFSENQALIGFVKDLYNDYNIYDNFLKIFDKPFNSPIGRQGIQTYNYVLADSAYIDNKWCYNIIYYPRRTNELTFKGDFWVNDTTWAVKEINMQISKSANINWIKEIYAEQEFDIVNDSTLLLKRDYFLSDFAFRKKESSRGVYGKRTTLYDNYVFNQPKDRKFYKQEPYYYDKDVYNREDAFWKQNRMEELNNDERGVYKMLDTLKTVKKFQRLYSATSILASGYWEIPALNFDFGPLFSTIGFNAVEGMRLRLGGRTYFTQNDIWRLEGFGAYGFKDQKPKVGISGKILLDRKSRLTLSGGFRSDIEQIGAQLTTSRDVLGRNFASSALVNTSVNDKLTKIKLGDIALSFEARRNLLIRGDFSFRTLETASKTFKLDYYTDNTQTTTKGDLRQAEVVLTTVWEPGKKTSGYGVERTVINEWFPSFQLNYTRGFKGLLGSDFSYDKVQFAYRQGHRLGGLGILSTTLELGKTYGTVPLSLLSPVPGNQALFSIYNTFSQLDFYEFITDEYASLHLQHNFGGRIFSKIPLLKKLNLRELVGFRAVSGSVSKANSAINASGITYVAPARPYYEYSVGVGNIFKVFRLDFNFRGNYRNLENARKFGITGAFGFSF